jgi:uncharacterized protein
MRKANKEIKDRSVIVSLLRSCHIGRLATNGRDGWPMVKPVNFAYENEHIHSALEGEKIDDIKRDGRVCFEMDLPIAFVRARTQPCEAESLYRSVIVKGRPSLASDEAERAGAFKGLMDKYQPEGGHGAYPPENKLARTGIIRIDIEEMTGKEDLGREGLRARALEALEKGVPLPIVL